VKIKVLAATVALALVVVAGIAVASLRGGEDSRVVVGPTTTCIPGQLGCDTPPTCAPGQVLGCVMSCENTICSGGPPSCPVYSAPEPNPVIEAILAEVARNRCGQATPAPIDDN